MALTTSVSHVTELSRAFAAQLPSLVKSGLGARLSEGFCGGTMPTPADASCLDARGTAPDVAGADILTRADAPLTEAKAVLSPSVARNSPTPTAVLDILRRITHFFPGGFQSVRKHPPEVDIGSGVLR
jgi:hypothetical protein